MSEDSDCVACRLVGGSGLIAMGLYVSRYSRSSVSTAHKLTVMGLATVLCGVGGYRLASVLPMFRRSQ